MEDAGEEKLQEEDPLDAFMASLDSQIMSQARVDTSNNSNKSSNEISNIIATTATSPLFHQHDFPTAVAHQFVPSALATPPSEAQIAVANKVADSPFCDVLGKEAGQRLHNGRRSRAMMTDNPQDGAQKTGGMNADEDMQQQLQRQQEACLIMLITTPGDFLRRFGHILTPTDLDSFLPSQDAQVNIHVSRLQALMLQQHRLLKDNSNLTGVDSSDDMDMPNVGSLASQGSACARLLPSQYSPGEAYARDNRRWRPHPPQSARARNRRYRRLQELAEGGVWFSDEAMKERDPWLWYEHVGRVEGGERPAPKAAVEEVPGSTTVRTYLQESLGFLSQQPKEGDWLASHSVSTPTVGAHTRGNGPSLGMAFLSGMCAAAVNRGEGDENITPSPRSATTMDIEGTAERERPRPGVSTGCGAPNMRAGEDIDCSYLSAIARSNASPPAAAAAVDIIAVDDIAIENHDPDGRDAKTSTEAVTAAVEACSIREEAEVERPGEHSGENSPRFRVVRFEDEETDEQLREAHDSEADESDGGDENGMQEDEEGEDGEREEDWGEPGGREEIARILSERFIAGDEEGVDYNDIDADERLDDLDQLARDEQDRWFRSQGDDATD